MGVVWNAFNGGMIQKIKRTLLYSLPVFIIYMIFFLIVYPGIWYGDEMWVINALAEFEVVWLQGLMTSVWDALAMMCIPVPSFLQIILVFFMSLSAGMVVQYLRRKIGSTKWIYLIYVPYVLPATIYFLFYVHRSSTVAVIELFIFAFMLNASLDDTISVSKTILIGVLNGTLYGFRNETIILEVIYIAVFFILFHKKSRNFHKVLIIFLPAVIFGLITVSTGNHRDTYSMAYIYNTLPYMVQEGEILEKDYEAINKVLDIEDMKSWDTSYVYNWAWGNAKYRDFSGTDFKNFKHAFWSMVRHNPQIYLYTLSRTFWSVTSMDREIGLVFLLSEHHEFYSEKESHNLGDRIAFMPLFPVLRRKICDELLLMKNGMYRIFYNLFPAIIGIFVSFLYGIKKRRFEYVLIGIGLAGIGMVLFFMAPEAQFMYWLPIYYIGSILLWMEGICILSYLRCRIRKMKQKN